MDLHCASDRLRARLAQSNPAQLPCLDILGRGADCNLNRYLGVHTRALENVEELLAIEHTEAFVDAAAHVLRRTIDAHSTWDRAALDANDNLVRVVGVLGEVFVEEVEGVALRVAVDLAAIPEIAAVGKSSFHGYEGF